MADNVYQLDKTRATWLEVEGEVVVLGTDNTVYMGVNGSGTQLWPLLVAGSSREQLVDKLTATYGIATEVAARDVAVFLEALQTRGLLTSA